MSNYSLFILLAVAICAAVVIFEYVHNKHRRFHIEHLGAAVQEILSGKQDGQMLRKDFLKALRVHFHCSPKEWRASHEPAGYHSDAFSSRSSSF